MMTRKIFPIIRPSLQNIGKSYGEEKKRFPRRSDNVIYTSKFKQRMGMVDMQKKKELNNELRNKIQSLESEVIVIKTRIAILKSKLDLSMELKNATEIATLKTPTHLQKFGRWTWDTINAIFSTVIILVGVCIATYVLTFMLGFMVIVLHVIIDSKLREAGK